MSAAFPLQERHRALFGVLYAEDFDADATLLPDPALETDVAEPEIIEPTYSAAELETAHAAGCASGRLEAERSLAASRVQMLAAIAHGLEGASEASASVAERMAEGVARTMMGALTACLPAVCARHGAAELQALARAVLPHLINEPRIAVRVHPLMVPAMEAEVAALDCEVAERVVLIPTEQMPPGDARMSWQDGEAVRDTGRVRRAVEDALAAAGLLEAVGVLEQEMPNA